MPSLGIRDIEREIYRANRVLTGICGQQPLLFRPPYGVIDQRAADCLKELGMTIVYWGVVPEDWSEMGSERVAQRVDQKICRSYANCSS